MKKVIATTNAPAAIGPYSQAVEVNGMIFISGQVPANPATGQLVSGGVREQTTQCFSNIKAILKEAGIETEPILICSGKNFPDSLSASATQKPIILVGDVLTEQQEELS